MVTMRPSGCVARGTAFPLPIFSRKASAKKRGRSNSLVTRPQTVILWQHIAGPPRHLVDNQFRQWPERVAVTKKVPLAPGKLALGGKVPPFVNTPVRFSIGIPGTELVLSHSGVEQLMQRNQVQARNPVQQFRPQASNTERGGIIKNSWLHITAEKLRDQPSTEKGHEPLARGGRTKLCARKEPPLRTGLGYPLPSKRGSTNSLGCHIGPAQKEAGTSDVGKRYRT